MTIEAHKATVTTASVTIKVLTVSGRQVTIALFQQFQDEDWEDSDGHLRGTPWGWVNRCPDRTDYICQRRRTHRHVVWQLGEELRRCCAAPPEELQLENWVHSDIHWLTVAVYSQGWRPSKWEWGQKSVRVRFPSGVVLEIIPSEEVRTYLNRWESHETLSSRVTSGSALDWEVSHLERAEADLVQAWGELRQVAEPLLGEMGVSNWRDAAEEEIKAAQERHERRQQNWKLAGELPQLCIAC